VGRVGLYTHSSSVWFDISYRGCHPSITLALNKWLYVAAVFNGTTARVYFNGTQIGASCALSPVTRHTNFIGYEPASTGMGGFDQIKIFNRALSAAEISADFSGFQRTTTIFTTKKKTNIKIQEILLS
jgi:hypothetical protein